jgi:hypothetical protein
MNKKSLTYAFFIAMLLTSFISQAQIDPCLTDLKDGATKTEQGYYDEAIKLLEKSIEDCKLSASDKIQARKLLIINYLAIDNLEAAAEGAATIMKINPNYEPDKLRDPIEVVMLFAKYKRKVVLRGSFSGGLNNSLTESIQTYSIVGDDDAAGLDNYQSTSSFQIGVAAEYRLHKELWLQLGLQFRKSGYKIDLPNIQGRTVSYREDLNYFDIPLSVKYYFLNSKFQPYVEAGANFSLLSAALGELSRDDLSDIVSRNGQRNQFSLGYFGGLGLAYHHKNFGFLLGVNYLFNPQQVNKEGTRYENLDIVFKYYYIDNDFTMNNLQLNVGFKYALAYKRTLNRSVK